MSTTVNIHEAKTHFSKLIERALNGEEIIVAKAGKPVIKLVPVDCRPKQRLLGSYKGRIAMHADFDDPIPGFEEYF